MAASGNRSSKSFSASCCPLWWDVCIFRLLAACSSSAWKSILLVCVRKSLVHSPGLTLLRIQQISVRSWYTLTILEKPHSSFKNLKPANWIHKSAETSGRMKSVMSLEKWKPSQFTWLPLIWEWFFFFSYHGRSKTGKNIVVAWSCWCVYLKPLYATANLFHRFPEEWYNPLSFISCQPLSNMGGQ